MAIDQESFNTDLYKLLRTRGYKPVPKDVKNQRTQPEAAEVFNFTFMKDGKDYGDAWVTIDDASNVVLYYSNEQEESPSGKSPGLDYDDSWSGLKRHLKQWSMNKQLTFELRNKDELGDDMAQRDYVAKKEKMNEGYHSMGKTASYNDNIPAVKIILQHNRKIEEGEQRYRNIAKIFLENQDGERFLAPTTRPGIAQVYARHIAEGGVPNDDRWNHIKSLCEEYSKMAGFVRATKNKQFNESAQQLVSEGINHYQSLRETLGKLRGHRGYNQYFESWTPALMEDDTDMTTINELFVQETLDPRIESVMPILAKFHKKDTPVKEVAELEEWADTIVEGDCEVEEGLDGLAGDWSFKDPTSNKKKVFKVTLDPNEIQRLVDAKRIGEFHHYMKVQGDQVTFMADNAGNLVADLDTIVDPGETSWSEILGLDVREGLDKNQKRVGQLGPTEKVGKEGAVGKLAGVKTTILTVMWVVSYKDTGKAIKSSSFSQEFIAKQYYEEKVKAGKKMLKLTKQTTILQEEDVSYSESEEDLNEASDYFTRGVERAWARGEPLETVMKKHGREAVPIWKKLEHEFNLKEVCSDCAGHGEDEEGLVCGSCEGTGEVESSREDELAYIKRLLR